MVVWCKKILKYFVFSVFLFTQAIAMDFESIIRDNASDPKKIISELQSIRDTDEVAEAFLYTFGGDNYQPVTKGGVRKQYSEEIVGKLKESALLIGSEMRKIGASEVNNEASLVISKRFLEFAGESEGHSFVDGDVSISFEQNQLDDMISNRRQYRLAIESLKKKKKADYTIKQIPSEILDDM